MENLFQVLDKLLLLLDRQLLSYGCKTMSEQKFVFQIIAQYNGKKAIIQSTKFLPRYQLLHFPRE